MSWEQDEDDIAYEFDWRDDDYWNDPLDGYEPDEPPYPCCGDGEGRCCNPTRWDRIRWALRVRLDRLLHPTRKDDPWGLSDDELPF